jgi:hypothetical protein
MNMEQCMRDIARATTGSIASEGMILSQNIEQRDPSRTRLRQPSPSLTSPKPIRLQRFKGVGICREVDITKEVTEPLIPALSPDTSGQLRSAGQAEKKTKTASTRISFIVRAGVTLLLFLLLFREISWSTLLSLFVHIKYTELLVGLCLGTLGVIFSAFLWHKLVLAGAGHHPECCV